MAGKVPDSNPSLRSEMGELSLVACGAIPGALLRWRLEIFWEGWGDLATEWITPLTVNLIGSFLLGFVSSGRLPRPRLMLVAGIGFCGSFTTFSGWILALARLMDGEGAGPTLLLLLLSLVGGVALAAAGASLGGAVSDHRHRRRLRR
jgi:CrcB protein